MKLEFRNLHASEIDARIGMVKPTGLTLLLYKDARVDINLLNETVGVLGWKREHQRIGDSLYCTVSIYDEDTKEWVSKQDVGTESYTEKEKGVASDSFKRACVNFGLGVELYTSPFIWVNSSDCNINNGKCYDKFEVEKITYTKDGRVDGLSIINTSKGNKRVFVQKPRGE